MEILENSILEKELQEKAPILFEKYRDKIEILLEDFLSLPNFKARSELAYSNFFKNIENYEKLGLDKISILTEVRKIKSVIHNLLSNKYEDSYNL